MICLSCNGHNDLTLGYVSRDSSLFIGQLERLFIRVRPFWALVQICFCDFFDIIFFCLPEKAIFNFFIFIFIFFIFSFEFCQLCCFYFVLFFINSYFG